MGLTVRFGPLLFILDPQRQMLNALNHLDRSRCEAGKGLQVIQLDGFKALRVQRVQRQQPPRLFINKQRATHAVVNFQMLTQTLHQSIVGIRQFAIAGEASRAGAAEQKFKARVFADFKPPAQCVET